VFLQAPIVTNGFDNVCGFFATIFLATTFGVSGLLAEGDRVAVRGAENLSEGAEVKIIVSLSAVKSTLE
jgi:hypothetical protein